MNYQENNNGELLTRQRNHVPESQPPRPAEPEKAVQSGGNSELPARFRELYRLLEREKASAESAISGKEYFLEQLRSNLRELEEISDELENLSGPGLRSEKERSMLLDKLFLRYYHTCGTIAGMREHETVSAVSDAAPLPKSFGTLFFENLPALIGTLLGAVIIAVVIAAVFC